MTKRFFPRGFDFGHLRKEMSEAREQLAPGGPSTRTSHASGDGAASAAPAAVSGPPGGEPSELARFLSAPAPQGVSKKPKRQPEAILEAAIIRAVEARGWSVEKRKVTLGERGGRKFMVGTPGHADIEVFLGRGRVCFLEVKTPTGTVKGNQKKWLERQRARGYVADVVRSVDDALRLCERALAQYGMAA